MSIELLPTPIGPHVAEGVCIVCGSVLVLAFWRGHPENRKVQCNDCGSEVTELMHKKKQHNNQIQRRSAAKKLLIA